MNKTQECELNLLKDFIRVCNEHHLTYYLVGGTALGAVRHQGFIPWDDDIDVGMPRKDFDELLKYKDEFKPGYFLQHYSTDPHYVYNFMKLRDSNTTFIENIFVNHRINHGVWIDIFPLDGFFYEETEYKKGKKQVQHFWNQTYLMYLPALTRKFQKETWFKDFWLNVVGILFKPLNFHHYRNKRLDKYLRKVDYDKAVIVGNHAGFNKKKEAMPKEVYGEGTPLQFEDITAMVPSQYDKYLTLLFNDYMTLPPESERTGHHHNKGLSLEMDYVSYMKKHHI